MSPRINAFTLTFTVVQDPKQRSTEWKGYNQVERNRQTVCHGEGKWARDEDGDGIREVHVNTIEGPQTTLRNFLRPFRGVHKKHLAGYVAICEFAINLKRITPSFISALVRTHDF